MIATMNSHLESVGECWPSIKGDSQGNEDFPSASSVNQ